METIQQYLQNQFEVSASMELSMNQLENLLAERINHLIKKDFSHLVLLLYRIDVNESKLKTLLKENPDNDAGILIARLVIERQLQKIETRRQSASGSDNIDENEKW